MQLPRGTFREIKKNETIESILIELERMRFSGICSISSGPATGTLVLKGGKCILVKFKGKSGDAGWDELQKYQGEVVDAALSTLDDAQVQLSLEFNKACRLVRGGKAAAPQQQKPSPPQRQEIPQQEPVRKPAVASHRAAAPPTPPVKPAPKPPAAATIPLHPSAPRKVPPASPAQSRQETPQPVSQVPPAPRPAAQPAEAPKAVPEDDLSSGKGSFEKDIDTFDSMDLENVTDKIRNDCKTMIKQLHLEHLMER